MTLGGAFFVYMCGGYVGGGLISVCYLIQRQNFLYASIKRRKNSNYFVKIKST